MFFILKETDLESIGILDAVRRDLEVAVLESGVGQTEAEREQNVLFCGVIVAVADIQTFAILDSCGMAGEVVVAGSVLERERIGLGKLAGGVDFSAENINKAFAATLAAEACPYNSRRTEPADEPHLDRISCDQNDNKIFILCGGFAECRLFFVCQIIFALYRSVVLVFARAAGNKEQSRLGVIAYAECP